MKRGIILIKCVLVVIKFYYSQGYDSVIRRMNILVCSGIDSMCAYCTFALKLEDK